MNTGTPLGDALEASRERVNRNRRIQARLASDAAAWLQFCASLDAVEDTDLALGAFLLLWKVPHDGASAVLSVYGALQSLQVQHDAVKRIVQHITGARHTKFRSLDDIRTTRNDAVGHPSNNAGFLVHGSLTHEKPQLLLPAIPGRPHQMKELDFVAMITKQRSVLTTALQEVTAHLASEDCNHMRKHSSKPLTPIASTLNAALRGIGGELWKTSDAAGPLLPWHIEATGKALDQLESALNERGELKAQSDTLPGEIKFARHCLKRLSQLAEAGAQGEQQDDAQAFLLALRHTCEILGAELARLDEEYGAATN